MESFSAYLRDIGRYPLLTKDQEIILARQVQDWVHGENPSPRVVKRGERAYQKLINCNLRLVVSIAKRYTNKCKRSELSDLVQEGTMGLAHGVKKFDPERGYALSTYVYWWIRQSITRYLATYDRVIRLPSHAVELLTKLRNWTPMFENTHGRKPTIQECAEFCKISAPRLQEYLDRSNDAISLDARVSSTEDDVLLIDSVSSDIDVFDDVSWGIDLEKVESILCRLQPRERYVVECSLGLGTNPPMTFQAISKELGISRERTRNIFHGSVRKLRVYFRKVD
jgi:RNA polymerase sigma factor (sigma-70 family)|tara:strand:- start:2565 stop:3410 length:846 start_codon:yes stop_codon:yes gene_type:complete